MKYIDVSLDKAKILKDNRKKAGVYLWINKINGKTYVGSSVNLSVRFYSYFSLKSLSNSNRPLERALLKYGLSNFSLEILEYCEVKDAIIREQFYIDDLKPTYNIAKLAKSTLGYKHTDITRKKMKNITYSEQVMSIKKLSTLNASEANKLPVTIENTITGVRLSYTSMTEAGKFLGVSRSAVSFALKNSCIIKKIFKIVKH